MEWSDFIILSFFVANILGSVALGSVLDRLLVCQPLGSQLLQRLECRTELGCLGLLAQ